VAQIGPILWQEDAETVSPSEWQFSRDEARCALAGTTDFANFTDGSAIKAILGFSVRTGPGLITRLPPMQCPMLPNLRATKIASVRFRTPAGSTTFGGQLHPYATKTGQGTPYATYTKAHMIVLFETLPYDILSNSEVAALAQLLNPSDVLVDEYYRWTLKLPMANVEQIIRPGNQFAFANGPASLTTPPTRFPQGLVVRAQKRDLVVKWFQVPALSLLAAPGPGAEPWNVESKTIAQAVGFVNDGPWHGYRRGEVLLKPSRMEPMTEPVPPEVLGLVTPGAVPRCYNVEWHFQVFQPPYDPALLIPAIPGGYVTFGHQTAPNYPANPNTATLYYYQISRSGPPGLSDPTQWLYPETNFDKLFQSI